MNEKQFNVAVMTIDTTTGESIKTMVIDYGNSDHRSWLAKHCWWALKEGFMVSTIQTEDPITFIDYKELRKTHA